MSPIHTANGRTIALLACLAASACGSSPAGGTTTGGTTTGGADPDGGSGVLASYNGIYDTVDITSNPAGCDAEGPSIFAPFTERLFFGQDVVPAGSAWLTFASCTDVEACRMQASKVRNYEAVTVEWLYTVDGVGPAGESLGITQSKTPTQGMCRGALIEKSVLTGTPSSVRIEAKGTLVPDYAPDATGACTFAGAQAASSQTPCTQLLVVHGTFKQSL